MSISEAESSYLQTGFLSNPPLRIDGRGLQSFRTVTLETGVALLSNGSARLSIGRNPHDGSGGTEIIAASKLEVETVEEGGADNGRLVCTVTCSPAAYPHLSSGAIEDLQYDLTTILHQTLSHPSLHPDNLGIISGKKSWLLNLDVVVLTDDGNVHDAIFMAARAALWDTKVPRTRSVEYKANKGGKGEGGDMDVDEEATSGFETRQIPRATDFELFDYWDEGEVLDGRSRWPVCVTLNLIPPVHFLDASLREEGATPLRLLLMYAFPSFPEMPHLQGIRMLGSGEVNSAQVKQLLKEGEKYAREVFNVLNIKVRGEDIRRNQKARETFAQR